MKILFVLKYWMLTLVIAPFIHALIINILNTKLVITGFEFYSTLLSTTLLFSIPTLIITWLAFIALSYTQLSQLSVRLITVAFTLAGINITLLLMNISTPPELMAAYSITAILVGLFLVYIERRKKKN